ncbi:hypothetical protein PVL29_011046 [Vitis rotundifolia]|uniref:Uncharacterized protein n=1 Tax=Vitis rotundifolia TaxID=103349 RepID=A0AA38ZW23_VITRO|nr:hypothetical protein PVL29_011046 [Vitis rotundifolia]
MATHIIGDTVEKTFRAGGWIDEANVYKETSNAHAKMQCAWKPYRLCKVAVPTESYEAPGLTS